jgi:hypothetical protein
VSVAENLALITEPTSAPRFFKEKIQEAQFKSGVKLSETVEFYLVNMLVDYIRVQEKPEPKLGNSASSYEQSNNASDCLALMLKKALESSQAEQVSIYKKLADTALYFSGFFQEYFFTKTFDVSYYISMGSHAYGTLAGIMKSQGKTSKSLSSMYSDLSREFLPAVDILTFVSGKSSFDKDKRSTLEVYDAWLNTSSSVLEKELYSRGIFPTMVSKKRN